MKHLRLETIALLILLSALMAFGSGSARAAHLYMDDDDHDHDRDHGAQLFVDDDHMQCPNAQFSSIQLAVDAAQPGDTINVCPGTYHEQVKINKRLTVRGIAVGNLDQAIIMPAPAVMNSTSLTSGLPIAAIVLVRNTNDVTLTNLTIDGLTNGINGCAPVLVGVYYRNASGQVDSLAVRNIKLGTGLEGCQSGLGIFVQSGNGGRSRVEITNNSVHDYQKNGITANEAGTEATIRGNAVSGIGSSPIIAQNGIQVAFGGTGTVDSNSVINHIYGLCVSATNCPDTAANILIFDSNGVRVTRNTTGKAQLNIYYQGNRGEVSNNTIFDTDVFDGLALVGNMNKASNNSIFNSDEAAVFVQGNRNEVNANTINETPIGILEFAPSSNNNFNGNRFFNTGLKIVPAGSSLAAPTSSLAAGGTQRSTSPAQP